MEKTQILTLLKKLEENNISPHEMHLLQQWSYENPDLLARYEKDVNIAWKGFDQQVKSIKPKTLRSTRHLWLKVAASLLLLVSVLYVYRLCTKPIIVYAAAEKREVSMPDGSSILLSPGSALSYSRSFGSDSRKVGLNGRAFFDIARDEDLPFVITTSSSRTTVLGTSFYLSEENRQVALDVVEGRVQLDIKGGLETIKSANESIAYDISSKSIIADEYSPNDNFWNTGILIFDDTPLHQVIDDLTQSYDVQITTPSQDITACRLTSRIENKSIEEVLNILSITYQCQWSSSSTDQYRLHQIKC